MRLHRRKTVPAAAALLWVLLLLASAACLACAAGLSASFDRAVSDSLSALPLAFPDAVITAHILPDEEDRNAVNAVGRGTVGALLPCSIGGHSVLLAGLPQSAFASVFPQEDADTEIGVPAGTFCTVLPLYGKDSFHAGDVLPVSDGVLSSGVLSVTAVKENPISVLTRMFPEQDSAYDCILFTDLSAWTQEAAGEHACILVEFGSTHKNNPAKAAEQLRSVAESTLSGRRNRYRARLAAASDEQAAVQAEALSANAAETEALKARIAALDTELAALETEIPAAEDAYLSADSALQKARQEFNSEMEFQEYHATNQTTLIDEKEKKELEFSVMQKDADAKFNRLNALYASRLSAQEERERAAAAIAALADAALAEDVPVSTVPAVSDEEARWTLSFASEQPLLSSLRTVKQKNVLPYTLMGVLLLIVTGLFGFLFCFLYRMPRGILLLLPVVLAVLGCMIGVLSGGTLLCRTVFPRVFGEALPVSAGGISGKALLSVFCALLFPFICDACGALLRRSRLRSHQ